MQDTMTIPLRKRDGEIVGYTIVDPCDYDYLMQWPWRLSPYGYALRCHRVDNKPTTVYLHREVGERMGLSTDLTVDHKNRDGLYNLRSNLRSATQQQQCQNRSVSSLNTSGLTGVCWNKRAKKYGALITHDGRRQFLGYFTDKAKAAAAYAAKAAELRGEFAVLNEGVA